jgi:hypothetical protein
VDIVVTSIGQGEFVSAYAELIAGAGAGELARMIVVPDRKTPRALYQAVCAARARDVDVLLPTLDQQQDLLARLGMPSFIPWDSDNRRNIGYLLAWMTDAEYVISLDDDNLPVERDLLARHAVVLGAAARSEVCSCASGWFNPCDLLALERPAARIFARGFPYGRRTAAREQTATRVTEATVRINAGLWLGDPDVDAVTRLALQPVAKSASRAAVVLDRDTWAPLNTQNTAFHRDVTPAYWFVRMGQRMLGSRLDRFGDILSGYFAQACAKHLGHSLRIGPPTTHHVRNGHALLDDLRCELPGILLLEHLLEWLRECKLEGTSYAEAYRALSHALDDHAERLESPVRTREVALFLHDTAAAMRQWLELLTRAR